MQFKKHTKKVTAAALAVLMTTGVVQTGAFSAFAAGEQEAPQLLWGDVDGNGEITIGDATMIQKYAIELPVENINSRVADVNSDKRVSILDVTCVQKCIAEYATGTGKTGQPFDGDKTYTTKALPVLRETLDSTETATVRFYDDQPNVPYMNVTDYYNQFYLLGTDLTEGMTCTHEGGVYTLTNIDGDTASLNIDADTIYVSDFEGFTMSARGLQVKDKGGMDVNYPFLKIQSSFEPAEATPITLSPGDYDIDLRGDDDGVYAPFATLSDIFATNENFYTICAGEKIYMKDYGQQVQPSAALDNDPDFLAAIQENHPADIAEFTYNELCFNIDLWYGQPGQETIHEDLQTSKIDEVLTEKYPEIKEKLLSRSFKTYCKGLCQLIDGLLFDGGHTVTTSALIMKNQDMLKEMLMTEESVAYSEKFWYVQIGRLVDNLSRSKFRDAAFGDDYYIEQGDTAIIRFDAFVVDSDGWRAFYAGTGERPLTFEAKTYGRNETMYDTIGTVLSGLERAKQNPEIKNIIIDMSFNGGGDSGAMLAIEWLFKGQGYCRYQNRQTQCVETTSVQFDMNFDGVFDEKDVSPYTDYNFGVLTSNYAFSCGNAFPWFMHDHDSMILGQKSSGGACAIRVSSAAGIEFASSAASSHLLSDSGENVDFGCPLDADLLLEGNSDTRFSDFYNLELISQKMNEYFNAE